MKKLALTVLVSASISAYAEEGKVVEHVGGELEEPAPCGQTVRVRLRRRGREFVRGPQLIDREIRPEGE